MSQPTYINIGASCEVFQETKPVDITTIVYLSSGTKLLKSSVSPNSSGYIEADPTSAGNVAVFSDYEFKIWFNESLIRSSANQSNWRYLTPATQTTAPTYSSTIQNTTAKTTNWPIGLSTITNDITLVSQPADSSRVYTIKSSGVDGIVQGFVRFPTIGIRTTENTPFYLQSTVNTSVYLYWDGTNYTTNDFSKELFNPSNVTQFSMFKEIITTPEKSCVLSIKRSDDTRSTGDPVFSSVRNDGTIMMNGVVYQIVFSISYVVDPSFPQQITMLKHTSTGKYLYWNGTYPGGTSTVSLKDYWADGLSLEQVSKGLQFYFKDMTFGINSAQGSSGIAVDYYQWMVRTDATTPAETSNANIFIDNNQFTIRQNQPPSNTEGWVLSGSSSPYSLVYIRADSTGKFNTVGYLSVGQSNTISYVSSSTVPDSSKIWECRKCTPNAVSGICETTS